MTRRTKKNAGDVEAVKATHAGNIMLGKREVPCANLPDGTRVVSEGGMLKALDRTKGGQDFVAGGSGPGGELPRYLAPKRLLPFVSEVLGKVEFKVIPYVHPGRGGAIARGIDARLIPEVCKVWTRARDAGVLMASQLKTAENAQLLLEGLATVGIIALIDEATGYQYDRDAQELQRILDAYVAKELRPWQRRFSQEFYREVFRLKSWKFNPKSMRRPKVVGAYTKKYIYEQLPPGVLDELQRRNPPKKSCSGKSYRPHKLFQFLTDDIGDPHLERQILITMTLMRGCTSWAQFNRIFERAHSNQIELFTDEDE